MTNTGKKVSFKTRRGKKVTFFVRKNRSGKRKLSSWTKFLKKHYFKSGDFKLIPRKGSREFKSLKEKYKEWKSKKH